MSPADLSKPPFNRPPFFVVGAPRSGTTYLRAVLSSHPGIFLTNETRVMIFASRAINGLAANEQALSLHRRKFVEMLKPRLVRLIRDFYSELGADGAVRWGDKHPHYADPKTDEKCLDTAVELFPQAQFVHIIRDGRDVAVSLQRKGWVSFDQALDVWQRCVLHARAFGERLGDDRYVEILYDDLIDDGRATVERLLDALGVPMTEEVAAFLAEQEESRTPFSKPTTAAVQLGTSTWRSELTPEQQEEAHRAIGGLLEELGYPVDAASG